MRARATEIPTEAPRTGKVVVPARIESLYDLLNVESGLLAADTVRFVDVTELPDDRPVLIGQIPLDALDFVVDPVGQRLTGNPAHGGERMVEIY
jgi:hypothetical protein